jgi:hypothetical protein
MDFFNTLDEVVQFELPDLAGAARLATLLRPTWPVSVSERNDDVLVFVLVDEATTDIGTLLRSVEDWVAGEALCAIRFELDGRSYVMEAGEADWELAPRAAA